MAKTIINKVKNTPTIGWKEIKDFEFNQLKDNLNRDVSKLKNSIVNNGFSYPFYIWSGHRFVIDGTGRYLALSQLEKDGYSISELPVVEIEAGTLKEAKRLVLAVSSSYGKISQSSLADFTNEDFEIEELKGLQLEELNLAELGYLIEDLNTPSEPDIDFDDINSTENREKKFREQLVTCPHCEGQFNMQV